MSSDAEQPSGPPLDAWLDTLELNRPGIERLAAELLTPSGPALYLELVYRMLLGRSVEIEALDHADRDFVAGTVSRRKLIAAVTNSREFREALLVEQLLADLPGTAARLEAGGMVGDEGTGERVVEIPWVLDRVRPTDRLLDVGYAHGSDTYLAALIARAGDGFHGVDLAVLPIPGQRLIGGDMCWLPFAASTFDVVTCVSTLEHVGRDNTSYGVKAGPTVPGSDHQALAEAARVLKPDGRLLVTVPFGRAEDHGWFVQYDARTWADLVA